jgi:uncharacterized protein (DUF2249 family)
MTINANTKIAPILKQNASALEAIISISNKFEKLRNPLLRKVMAGRTTLAMASRFGGCHIDDFYEKLEPLGFEIDRRTKPVEEKKKPVPQFIHSISKEKLKELDVRPVIASGRDPLNIIMQKVKTIQSGEVLKIVNTFEPTPLIMLLQKRGFETYADKISDDHVETYFYKSSKADQPEVKPGVAPPTDWDQILQKFADKIKNIDVRHLPMPQPMITILETLDTLPPNTALYIYHKRIPVFLLPELEQRGFEHRIKEISDGEVHLMIFRS